MVAKVEMPAEFPVRNTTFASLESNKIEACKLCVCNIVCNLCPDNTRFVESLKSQRRLDLCLEQGASKGRKGSACLEN